MRVKRIEKKNPSLCKPFALGPHLIIMTSPEEEQKLIQGLSQGDPGSYDRLVDLYGKKIFRLALQLSGERFDAEDIVL